MLVAARTDVVPAGAGCVRWWLERESESDSYKLHDPAPGIPAAAYSTGVCESWSRGILIGIVRARQPR